MDNISYFMITSMDIEYIPQPNPKDSYDLLSISIMDLETLETFIITEMLPQHSTKTTTNIDGTLAKILFENGLSDWEMTYTHLNLKHSEHQTDLISDYCIKDPQYFFNAIKLTDNPKDWDDLIFIPSSQRQQTRLLKSISEKLRVIDIELNSMLNK